MNIIWIAAGKNNKNQKQRQFP